MVGTKNNLTIYELETVQKNGFTNSLGKVYSMIDTKEATHLELRLRYTDAIVCIDVDGHKENGDITLEEFWKIEGLPEFLKLALIPYHEKRNYLIFS